MENIEKEVSFRGIFFWKDRGNWECPPALKKSPKNGGYRGLNSVTANRIAKIVQSGKHRSRKISLL
jgi:hypothetical protein